MKLQKLTNSEQGSSRRRYDDACGTAHGLELIGERWALLVMRELMLGPKRFSDIRADLPGISANVLTQRLEGLEASGLLTRKKLPPPANTQVYELTEWGYEAEPIVQTLGRWAARSPAHDPTLPISASSIMLSFRTMFDAERAKGFAARIGFRLGSESFVADIRDGSFKSGRGDPDGADVIFTGAPQALAAAVYGEMSFDELAAAGALMVEGDRKLADRFTTLFVLPPKADISA
ncbi:MAG TPA: winged helix-turn-helix transcriptional regulator [Allosphingosinicella sp.]|uniref:winged helix-turn-helix transcriptional regulator n=1 Tax=Allosphingosinicella sp. TaxID=2823234 RepID=UPI002EDB7D68